MDISFLLSSDELLTLMSLAHGRSEAGQRFADEALSGAQPCDLSGLVDKKLARIFRGELDIAPVVRMVADSLSLADTAAPQEDGGWMVRARWASLYCEPYPYQNRYWKITPVKEGQRDGHKYENHY